MLLNHNIFFHEGTIDSAALHKSMEHMNREYGDIVKFPELADDHDIIFLFDVNDVEKVLKYEIDRYKLVI